MGWHSNKVLHCAKSNNLKLPEISLKFLLFIPIKRSSEPRPQTSSLSFVLLKFPSLSFCHPLVTQFHAFFIFLWFTLITWSLGVFLVFSDPVWKVFLLASSGSWGPSLAIFYFFSFGLKYFVRPSRLTRSNWACQTSSWRFVRINCGELDWIKHELKILKEWQITELPKSQCRTFELVL